MADRIIGMTYSMCVMKTHAIFDIIAVITSLTCECGIIGESYKRTLSNSPNFLYRAMFLATSPRWHIIAKQVLPTENYELCIFLTSIVDQILKNSNKWPDEDFRKQIISIVFETEENFNIRDTISAIIQEVEYEINDLTCAYIIGGLYTLVKFITNLDKEKYKGSDISMLYADIMEMPEITGVINALEDKQNVPHTNTHKYIAAGLIGLTTGYIAFYKHQPFFQARDNIDAALKLYFIYLAGEKRRVQIGRALIAGQLATRWVHPPNEPDTVKNTPWHVDSLPVYLHEIAKHRKVTYIEYMGNRYQTLSQLADKANVSAEYLEAIDKKIVAAHVGIASDFDL